MSESAIQSIPLLVRPEVAKLAAEVIEQAASYGRGYWGLTQLRDGIRVNVGWTEILTALPDHIRVIVDGKLARKTRRPKGVTFRRGKDDRGYYPSVPHSICAEIPYQPVAVFEQAIGALRPALTESVRQAARRPPKMS